MVLQWQEVEYPLTKGVDQYTAEKSSSDLMLLENGEFKNPGAINKRNGFGSYSALSQTPQGVLRTTSSSQYLMSADVSGNVCPSTLYSYSTAISNDRPKGYLAFIHNELLGPQMFGYPATTSRLAAITSAINGCDCLADSAYTHHLQQVGGSAYLTHIYQSTGALFGQEQLHAELGGSPTAWSGMRFVSGGLYNACIGLDTTDHKIKLYKFAKNSRAVASSVPVEVATTGNARWDVCVYTYSAGHYDWIAVLWEDASYHLNITIWDLVSNAQVATKAFSGITCRHIAAAADAVSLSNCGGYLVATYPESPGSPSDPYHYRYWIESYVGSTWTEVTASLVLLASLTATDQVYSATACASILYPGDTTSDTLIACSLRVGATNATRVSLSAVVKATGAIAHYSVIPYAQLASKAITFGGYGLFWVSALQDLAQSCYYAMSFLRSQSIRSQFDGVLAGGASSSDVFGPHTWTKALQGSALMPYYTGNVGALPSPAMVVNYSTDVSIFTFYSALCSVGNGSDHACNFHCLASTMAPFNTTAALDTTMQVSAGLLSTITERDCIDTGWPQAPVIDSVAEGAPASGSLTGGTYSYRACFEYTDSAGNFHRSAPSALVTHAIGANKAGVVTVRLAYYGDALKYRNGRIALYRTVVHGGVMSSTYYYTGTVAQQTNPTDSVASTGVLTDTIADATVEANESLYTTGGELDAIPAPAPACITSSNDRIYVLDSDDPSRVWYSKPKAEGLVPEFYDGSYLKFPEAIYAIRYDDGKLYAFADAASYYVYGAGPASDGGGDQFSQPQILSHTVGCQNPASICETPVGLYFQSGSHLYPLPGVTGTPTHWLMTAPGQFQPLQKMQDHVLPVTSAIYDRSKHRLLATQWTSCSVLTMDTLNGQCGTWEIPSEDTYNIQLYESQTVPSIIAYKGKWRAFQQTTYLDPGYYVKLMIRTPWIKPGQLINGCGRVKWIYLRGTYKSAHTLNVNVYYDDDSTTVIDTHTVALTTSTVPYLFRFRPSVQKCNSIMLEIYDTGHSGTGESFSLDALMFVVGKKPRQVLSSAKTL